MNNKLNCVVQKFRNDLKFVCRYTLLRQVKIYAATSIFKKKNGAGLTVKLHREQCIQPIVSVYDCKCVGGAASEPVTHCVKQAKSVVGWG